MEVIWPTPRLLMLAIYRQLNLDDISMKSGGDALTFFDTWRGTLELPPLPERKMRVGGNTIYQRVFLGAQIQARIAPSQYPNFDLITTNLETPYREILLRRKKGAHRPATTLPIVKSGDAIGTDALPDTFLLEWEALGELETYASTPADVLEAWKNKFDFRTEDEAAGLPGLRTPQIGALHAISAHFAVGTEFEAATVVLPTGTGKTETMLATLVYRRLGRVIVMVPSDALRWQIAEKFITLGILPMASVVRKEVARPRVAVISTGIRTVEDATALAENANVIVALPNSLESSNQEVVDHLIASCTDLIVDEAHHVTATTWDKVKTRFAAKRVTQFTATPFRQNGDRIEGKIIFNYKLGDAQAAGYYRPINLVTVEEYGEEGARDRAVASAAVSALRRDRGQMGLDHLLMARTSSKERAESVVAIYRELAPETNPILVYSGPGRTLANRQALNQLLDRSDSGARIVVCVNMLGEGFDLPNLKIAALHDNHKSLAITLQFIGRFTRTGNPERIGEATVVTNIADPAAEKKLSELYAEGADWDHLIRRLSEDRIEDELKLQDIVFGLREKGDLGTQLSLWNLRPALSCQFFSTKCGEWDPLAYKTVLPASAETWYALSDRDNTLVAVVCRAADVSWGNYQNVVDTIYDLVVLRWDKEAGALAVYASDYDAMRSEMMAKAVTDEETELVSGDPIFRILNNVELPLVKSLGSSRKGAISFTSYFGPNVTEGLASIEKAESELNNLACLGYENGERVIWGGTQRRGKVWQQKGGSIADWITWTAMTWGKVASEEEPVSNVLADFLRPIKITQPYASAPIAVQWGEQAQTRMNNTQHIVFDGVEVPLLLVDLGLLDMEAGGPTRFRIASESAASEYTLTIDEALPGGYKHERISGPALQFKKNRTEQFPLEEYLQKDPLIVHYADGTYSYNCYHIPASLNAGEFDKDRLEAWDWSGTPLNRESMGKTAIRETIQYRTFERLAADYDLIINDDGPGEAADLVCFKDVDETTIRLALVHCKGAHDARVSRDIRNFYIVCGQAQTSITAKHAGVKRLADDLRRRQETWAREGKTRFLKGEHRALSFFADKSRRAKLEFEMILVQPGGSASDISSDALRLLATTELYLMKTTQAKFRVILSA